jgi:hypothetical protein
MYEFRVRRSHRHATAAYAIRRAREVAFADGVTLFGDPVVISKRVPIPMIGPRREFVVTFPRATRRAERANRIEATDSGPLPGPLHQEANLPDLHRVVDEVNEVG